MKPEQHGFGIVGHKELVAVSLEDAVRAGLEWFETRAEALEHLAATAAEDALYHENAAREFRDMQVRRATEARMERRQESCASKGQTDMPNRHDSMAAGPTRDLSRG